MFALRLSLSDKADATVKIAISPEKNAFLPADAHEFSSGQQQK
jgi:hypothetical protein